MNKNVPIACACLFSVFVLSCGHKYYKAANFEEKTLDHRVVAVIPAEMIFTGNQPKNMDADDIARAEEQESRDFQLALYNSILRHANAGKYITTVNFQDLQTTRKKLEEKNIGIRDCWKMDDREIAEALGVDAVIRMRIRKKRYMSDAASYGVDVSRRIIRSTGIGSKIPLPQDADKTNDIDASCSLLSNNQTLWNDHYKAASDWNAPAEQIIENITDNFGRHFPYKKKRK